MSRIGDLFHTGMVVDDIEQAMADLSVALGVHWTSVSTRNTVVRTEAGDEAGDLLVTYTIEGPPHIELIEDRARGIWHARGLDHLGFWVDDLPAAMARLEAAGHASIAHGLDDAGRADRFAYHENANGLAIELVDRRIQDDFAGWLAGGTFS